MNISCGKDLGQHREHIPTVDFAIMPFKNLKLSRIVASMPRILPNALITTSLKILGLAPIG